MKILALDTSCEYCSVALWRDGDIEAMETHAGQSHSTLLLGMIDDLLARHGLRVKQLDGIAFGEGPGSFTGLRIGCGVTQGLAFAAGLPVVGVGTLLAMAAAAGAERVVCCMDARMQEIYHAAYEKSGDTWDTVCAPSVAAPEAAPLPPGEAWLGCGSGFSVYREALARRYEGRLSDIAPDVHPHARDIAVLAAPLFAAGAGMDAALAAPVYIRDKVALRTDER
ncbi:MAG: tRNA (adenosine(37)-N6)-threonylcarbamoyltransferase complex dimerization subunit type 1 TsaB [Burkholderiales bacterium]|nr:tRNA (adenosine(37)-N6)-threonylcarbamoyltransferase complex dimerization subunit type 1 TsaB [Burkholderiales bacterium]